MICPRCGSERCSQTECLDCGIILAKYQAKQPRQSPVFSDNQAEETIRVPHIDQQHRTTPQQNIHTGNSKTITSLLIIVLFLCVITAALVWYFDITFHKIFVFIGIKEKNDHYLQMETHYIPQTFMDSIDTNAENSSNVDPEKLREKQVRVQAIEKNTEFTETPVQKATETPVPTPDIFATKLTDDIGNPESFWRKRYHAITSEIENINDQKSQIQEIIEILSQPLLIEKVQVSEDKWILNHPGVEGTIIDGRIANLPEISRLERQMEDMDKHIEKLTRDIKQLREECRKSGCLPGWVR